MDPRRQVCACLLGIPDAKLHVKDLERFPLAQLWWKAGLLLKARFCALDFDAILLCFALDNHNHMSGKKQTFGHLRRGRWMLAKKEHILSQSGSATSWELRIFTNPANASEQCDQCDRAKTNTCCAFWLPVASWLHVKMSLQGATKWAYHPTAQPKPKEIMTKKNQKIWFNRNTRHVQQCFGVKSCRLQIASSALHVLWHHLLFHQHGPAVSIDGSLPNVYNNKSFTVCKSSCLFDLNHCPASTFQPAKTYSMTSHSSEIMPSLLFHALFSRDHGIAGICVFVLT